LDPNIAAAAQEPKLPPQPSNHAYPQPLLAERSGPLTGTIIPPGDKSISHRALIFGAMAESKTTIQGLLESEDVLHTAESLRRLGTTVTRLGPGHWTVHGLGVGGFHEPAAVLDHGNSGTGVRLMMGAVATTPITVTFTGDASLNRRPMGRILKPLSAFGCQALSRGDGYLPLTMRGAQTPIPIRHEMSVPSAQVKSAILLAGLNAPGTTVVIESEATRDHTERMLLHFGARLGVERDARGRMHIALEGQPELKPAHVVVPGDPSSAAFAIVAALIVPGSKITLRNVLMNATRTGLFTTLLEMGAKLSFSDRRLSGGEEIANIAAEFSALVGVEVPPSRAPSMIDEYPILSIAAAFAEGRTIMRGLGELKVKESDRLSATADGLKACGASVAVGDDFLTVDGSGAQGLEGSGLIATHMDHRIAMSFLIAGLAARHAISIDDGAMIATSFPDFIETMNGLGAAITTVTE
jgi:3-phosphoshikimate 1-carboxyvinyltransferase